MHERIRPDVSIVVEFARSEWSNLTGVLAYGSYVAGRPDEDSDIDAVIILSELERPYSQEKVYKGSLLDLQVHDYGSLRGYMKRQFQNRIGMLATVIRDGTILLDTRGEMEQAQELANEVLSASLPDVDWARYRAAITAQLKYLRRPRPSHQKLSTLVELYRCLTNVMLLRDSQWLVEPKLVVETLTVINRAASGRFHRAFVKAINGQEDDLVREAEAILDSIGGVIRIGEKCFG